MQKKQKVVHCTTQEEWDFVSSKIGNNFTTNWFKDRNEGNNKSYCIGLYDKNKSQSISWYESKNYQILSFQEWLDENGYTFDSKEVAGYKVGDWVYTLIRGGNDTEHKEHKVSYNTKGTVIQIDHFSKQSRGNYKVAVSKEGHVIYIESYSRYFRKATQEEIDKVNPPKPKNTYNNWYKYKGYDKFLAYITKRGAYGFSTSGTWFEKEDHYNIQNYDLVLDESEVKSRLLEYAKEKYPIGTEFKSALYSRGSFTVNSNFYFSTIYTQDKFTIFSKGMYIYTKGKWAEIISKPESESTNIKKSKFKVGDIVNYRGENTIVAAIHDDHGTERCIVEYSIGWKPCDNSSWYANYKKTLISGKLDDDKKYHFADDVFLVSIKSKEFDRNWYIKVNNQEEADKVFEWLESQGEKVGDEGTARKVMIINGYYYLKYNNSSNFWWIGSNDSNKGKTEKKLSDILPDYPGKTVKKEVDDGPVIQKEEPVKSSIKLKKFKVKSI